MLMSKFSQRTLSEKPSENTVIEISRPLKNIFPEGRTLLPSLGGLGDDVAPKGPGSAVVSACSYVALLQGERVLPPTRPSALPQRKMFNSLRLEWGWAGLGVTGWWGAEVGRNEISAAKTFKVRKDVLKLVASRVKPNRLY